MTEIRHRETREVIVSGEGPVAKVLQQAVADGVDLAGANLRCAKLNAADLTGAKLTGANLNGADLTGADLSGADLRGAKMGYARLNAADLTGADLTGAKLSGADLTDAKLNGSDLTDAELIYAHLSDANLSYSNLTYANLIGADLDGANLTGANLTDANLSQCNGLLDPEEWLADCEHTDDGIIVYKAERGQYDKPAAWRFEPGAELRETVNRCPTTVCGSGVNVAKTAEWCRAHYPGQPIWQCLIPRAAEPSIVVPYNTDRKLRCSRVVLLKVVDAD